MPLQSYGAGGSRPPQIGFLATAAVGQTSQWTTRAARSVRSLSAFGLAILLSRKPLDSQAQPGSPVSTLHLDVVNNSRVRKLTVVIPSVSAGTIAVFSTTVVPSLLRSRAETNLSMTARAKQWREIYETGKRQNPPIAALTAASLSTSRSSPPADFMLQQHS
ncbi:hypothetical protein AnigIFM62618_011288 [Aspergillus niger]|nr:hypothetical protein AnigIFM62618_011288 [Aspergillus niger]